jgi:hypothetical protein
MGAVLSVDRAQAMAFRVAGLQLDSRVDARPADLAVLDLGIQEYTPGSLQVALAARTTAPPDDDRLLTAWAARGAPHLLRRADLPALAAALWPVSDADATARIATTSIRAGAKLGLAAFTAAAEAFRAAVTAPMPRGDVSTAVSARVPASLTYDCAPCGARHISGSLFQQAGLAGGVHVESRGAGATLAPIGEWPGVPSVAAGTDGLLRTYLRLLGPATAADAAKYLGTTTKELGRVWPDDLAEVTVDGRTAWLPAASVDALRAARRVPGVRLLPAADPLLQARDRDLLVPGKERQSAVWRVLGNPGVLLVDGDIAGIWRAKMAGRKRVDITVTPFGKLAARTRAGVDAEAAVVGVARGAAEARIIVE